MLSTFTIIINKARSDSWPDIVWRDALASGARVLLDSCIPLPRPLRKLRKILRLKEAVCYNKCLLTNNRTVTSSPYYRPEYMQVFEQIDDISMSSFARHADYHYQGEFSPRKLMERIVEMDKK